MATAQVPCLTLEAAGCHVISDDGLTLLELLLVRVVEEARGLVVLEDLGLGLDGNVKQAALQLKLVKAEDPCKLLRCEEHLILGVEKVGIKKLNRQWQVTSEKLKYGPLHFL